MGLHSKKSWGVLLLCKRHRLCLHACIGKPLHTQSVQMVCMYVTESIVPRAMRNKTKWYSMKH